MGKDDLPPPVTQESSKRALWEELQCANEAQDRLQGEVRFLREELASANAKLQQLLGAKSFAEHQVNVIRAVLAGQLK